MSDLSSDIGLLRHEVRGGIIARLAAVHLIARAEHRQVSDAARQAFSGDRELAQWIARRIGNLERSLNAKAQSRCPHCVHTADVGTERTVCE